MGIDIQDDKGRHEVGFVENTIKTPLGANEEGCLFEARFHINKVNIKGINAFNCPFSSLVMCIKTSAIENCLPRSINEMMYKDLLLRAS